MNRQGYQEENYLLVETIKENLKDLIENAKLEELCIIFSNIALGGSKQKVKELAPILEKK